MHIKGRNTFKFLSRGSQPSLLLSDSLCGRVARRVRRVILNAWLHSTPEEFALHPGTFQLKCSSFPQGEQRIFCAPPRIERVRSFIHICTRCLMNYAYGAYTFGEHGPVSWCSQCTIVTTERVRRTCNGLIFALQEVHQGLSHFWKDNCHAQSDACSLQCCKLTSHSVESGNEETQYARDVPFVRKKCGKRPF